MKVQIVIPSINLWNKYTKPCIESVIQACVYAKKHNVDCRILLIDNASTDETSIEAGKMVSDIFAHKRNEERWGFQKSVNYGVNDAWERGFDYVLVLNNDVLIHREAIWRLVERFEHGFYEGSEVYYPVGMVTAMDVRGETTPEAFFDLNPNDKATTKESENPNFSAFMVKKQTWELIGEFDELFAPAYFEDNDYHYRMKQISLVALCLPTALFYHYGSRTQNESTEDGAPLVSGTKFENNRAKYVEKWGGVPGEEKFSQPYDSSKNSITDTLQFGYHH